MTAFTRKRKIRGRTRETFLAAWTAPGSWLLAMRGSSSGNARWRLIAGPPGGPPPSRRPTAGPGRDRGTVRAGETLDPPGNNRRRGWAPAPPGPGRRPGLLPPAAPRRREDPGYHCPAARRW